MRPQPMKYAVALLGCVSFFTTTTSAAEWNGSYSANGQCFCVGDVAKTQGTSIVPTPIGGQTVAQVCDRVGVGPGLSKIDGLFNHPVYKDAQCGNGPFAGGLDETALDCAGTLDGEPPAQSSSCQPVGANWDLQQAFGKTPAVVSAKPGSTGGASAEAIEQRAQALINKPVVSTHSVKSKSANGVAGEPLKATVISSASTANRSVTRSDTLPPFTGRDITIDGQRYLQAREGMDAKGGKAGSRIILDGLVFLREDDAVSAEDLYRVQPKVVKAPAKKIVAAKKPVANTSSVANAAAEKQQAEREKQDRLAAETRRRADAEKLRLAKLQLDLLAEKKAREQALKDQPAVGAAQPSSIYSPEDLDTQASAKAQDKQRDQSTIPPSPLSTPIDKPTQIADSEAAEQVVTATSGASDSSGASQSTVLSALRLPAEVRASSQNFSYFEALPASYDVGGSGIVLEGSAQSHSRLQYVGRIGVTGSYQELMVGGGYYLTPASADRFTVVLLAGVEYGSFELTDEQDPSIEADLTDSGIYLGAATRYVLNNRFELKAGMGFSTFFEGDAMLFGGGYYHITPRLDLVSRFELGDNDLLGIGVRFYY